jgi:hypothetical protein
MDAVALSHRRSSAFYQTGLEPADVAGRVLFAPKRGQRLSEQDVNARHDADHADQGSRGHDPG